MSCCKLLGREGPSVPLGAPSTLVCQWWQLCEESNGVWLCTAVQNTSLLQLCTWDLGNYHSSSISPSKKRDKGLGIPVPMATPYSWSPGSHSSFYSFTVFGPCWVQCALCPEFHHTSLWFGRCTFLWDPPCHSQRGPEHAGRGTGPFCVWEHSSDPRLLIQLTLWRVWVVIFCL